MRQLAQLIEVKTVYVADGSGSHLKIMKNRERERMNCE